MDMGDLFAVLPQEVLSIVIPIGRPDYSVDVITGRPVAFKGYSALMVELD